MKINNFRMKMFVSAFVVLSCFVSSNVFGKVEKNINRSFTAAPGGRLSLETDFGDIKVNSAAGDSVEVGITFRHKRGSQSRFEEILEDFNADVRQNGSDVTICVVNEKNKGSSLHSAGKYLEIEFVITVPQQYDLDLNTEGGDISIGDLEGEVRSSTSGGKLVFSRITGAIVGRTSGGGIMLDACRGNVDVETSGGKIHIGKVAGNIVAHTSGGSIDVDEVMGSIWATTSGGSVTARISEQPENDCALSSSGGNITAYLEQGVKMNVNAGTSGGRVKTDFPVTAVMKGEIDIRSLQGTINGGGPELYLHTSGGNIYINKL